MHRCVSNETGGVVLQIMPPMRQHKRWAAVEETRWEGASVEGTWDVVSWARYAAGELVACTSHSQADVDNPLDSGGRQSQPGNPHHPRW